MFGLCSRKSCQETGGKIVGHIPMEISRPTKFLLEQGAEITATLMSSSYYACPLVQGGLEIPCFVEVFMPLTFKNKEIVSKHKELIEALYQEKDV